MFDTPVNPFFARFPFQDDHWGEHNQQSNRAMKDSLAAATANAFAANATASTNASPNKSNNGDAIFDDQNAGFSVANKLNLSKKSQDSGCGGGKKEKRQIVSLYDRKLHVKRVRSYSG